MGRMQNVTVDAKKKKDEWKRATSQSRYRHASSTRLLGFCDLASGFDEGRQGPEGLAQFEEGVLRRLEHETIKTKEMDSLREAGMLWAAFRRRPPTSWPSSP